MTSDAARKALQRRLGRQVSVILHDRAAIQALDELARLHGSQRAAIEAALKQAWRDSTKV